MRFLRYVCAYCVARLLFESVRGPRKNTTENPPCRNHFLGIIGGIIILILALDVLLVLFGAYLNGNPAR